MLAGTIIGIIPILIVVFVIVEPERSPRTSLDWVASFVHKEKTRLAMITGRNRLARD